MEYNKPIIFIQTGFLTTNQHLFGQITVLQRKASSYCTIIF